FLMSSRMLLLVWLIFFMVLIKLLPILGTISGKTVKLLVLPLICLGNNRQDGHPPNCMFSCLQILEAFLWFVLITLLNVTLIILTLSVSRLLNLLLRLVAVLLFLNPQCLASISRWITASSSWKRFCLFLCRALSSIMVICMLTAIRLLLTFVMSLYLLRSEERFSRNAETDLVCRLLLEKKKENYQLENRAIGELFTTILVRIFAIYVDI